MNIIIAMIFSRVLIIVFLFLPFIGNAQIFKQGVISIDDVLVEVDEVTSIDAVGISGLVYFEIDDDMIYLKTGSSPIHTFHIDSSATDRRWIGGIYLTRAAIMCLDTGETGTLAYTREKGLDYWLIHLGSSIITMTDR